MKDALAPPNDREVKVLAAIPSWTGAPLCGAAGAPLGRVREVLFDEATRSASWFVADVDGRRTLIPAQGALSRPQFVVVPHDQRAVRRGPRPHRAPPAITASGPLRLSWAQRT